MKVQLYNGKNTSIVKVCKKYMQIDENDSIHHTTSYKNSKEPSRKNKLPVTVVLGDLIMKGLKSSDKKK